MFAVIVPAMFTALEPFLPGFIVFATGV